MKLNERVTNIFLQGSTWLSLSLIVLIGVVAYSNTFSVPLHYDDIITLRKNLINPLDVQFGSSLRWVVDLTFSLNRLVHGEVVTGYHVVNLAIHLFTAVCVYFLVLSVFSTLQSSFSLEPIQEQSSFLQKFIPFSTAILFVCHPVQTQAITYISQRYAALATLFYITSLLSYVRARTARGGMKAWILGFTALFLAILAMMSKEIAFTLPLMVVVLEITVFKGLLLKNLLFLAVCAGVLMIIPVHLLHNSGIHSFSATLGGLQQISTEVEDISRGDYFLTQLRVIVTYLRLIILPINQNLDYDYPIQYSLNLQVLASLCLHFALIACAVNLYIRARRSFQTNASGDGAVLLLSALGIVWFYLTLAVESSIIPIRDVIFEHRLYLPSVGIIMSAVCLAALAADRKKCRIYAWLTVVVCSIVLTGATLARNQVWRSELRLWNDVVKKSPLKARAVFNVGMYTFMSAKPEQALPFMVRAIELAPEENINYWIFLNGVISQLNIFEGRFSSGLHYHEAQNTIIPRYMTAWRALSYNNLGLAYEYLGNTMNARLNFKKAAALDPKLDLAWLNLAVIAARLHDQEGFSGARDRLSAINPDLARSVETFARMPAKDRAVNP